MPEFTINDRFVLAEESALKAKVSGLKVTYPKDIDVDVWFGWPNKEIREVTYPFIVLNLADVVKADYREHSGGRFELSYLPHNYEGDPENPHLAPVAQEWPTPYDIFHFVTVVSLDPRHDRELTYKLLGDRARLPMRWAHLHIPEDGTDRRIDVVDLNSTVERGPTMTQWATTWSLKTESELFVGEVGDVWRVYEKVHITLNAIGTDIYEEIGTFSAT